MIQRTSEYKKVRRETHRPINLISLIDEFGIKRRIMLPSTGQRIRPLRSKELSKIFSNIELSRFEHVTD